MGKSEVDVIVHWVDVNENGKVKLPVNTPYYVITDPLKGASGKQNSWSLVLKIHTNSGKDVNRIGFGKAYFLVDDAPSELLVKGFSLKVYEGKKFVAIVEIT
ncbi:hypothetical protein [Mixta calida]|uniref:hypothetical protein n=1 Tax=Mixta calida TaxID=665913 RepID=UPI00403A8CE1